MASTSRAAAAGAHPVGRGPSTLLSALPPASVRLAGGRGSVVSSSSGLPRGSGNYAGVTVSGQQRQIIEQAVGRGESASAIQQALQENGLGIRRQALLEVVREARGTIGSGDVIQNTAYSFRPSAGAARPVTYNLGADFMVRAQLEVPTLLPGSPHIIDASFKYNGQLTRAELVEELLAIMTPRLQSLGLVDESGNPLVSSEELRFTSFIRQGE